MLRLLTWPFRLALDITGWVLSLTGRMLAFILGALFCCLGVLLCMTGIGAIMGVPLVIFSGGLMLKSIF